MLLQRCHVLSKVTIDPGTLPFIVIQKNNSLLNNRPTKIFPFTRKVNIIAEPPIGNLIQNKFAF